MKIKKAGVVGAGMMGAEIALCFALAGVQTVMTDKELELARKGRERQEAILRKSVEKNRLTDAELESTLARIQISSRTEDMADAELVVEAAVENADVKNEIFKELDAVCRADTVFATNTSSLSVTALAASVSPERQKRFIGMHFFSPASRMKLVEIVPGYVTEKETVEAAREAAELIGKEYIIVKDVCGFVVNRMLNIFFIEAIRLVEEGVASPEDIDKACRLGLSHPVGPLELLDITSRDLNLSVHSTLFREYGERFRPRPLLKKMVAAGRCGKKSGEGFFQYGERGAKKG